MNSFLNRVYRPLFHQAAIRQLLYKKCFYSSDNKPDISDRKKFIKYGLFATAAALLYTGYTQRSQLTSVSNSNQNGYQKNVKDIANSISAKGDTSGETETLRERYNFINKVVKKCAPAVFYLEIRDPNKKDIDGKQLITSNGSGFIISEDGWALTNAHVILNKPHSLIRAILRDGNSYGVEVEDVDMNIDLALLKLDVKEKVPCLKFGDGDTTIGEWVVALGSPLSLSNSVTVGIISCVNRPAHDLGLKNFSMSYIQTDAAITFGNSGGPLVNLDGNVIGINNLRLTSGISFAIPVEYAKKFLENTKYRVKGMSHVGAMGKSLFGVTTISITPEVITELLRTNKNLPQDIKQGLLIWKVVPETPAAKGGLKVGDIITHINGVPVTCPADLYLTPASNKTVEISVIQQGKRSIIYLQPELFEDCDW